MVLTVALAWRSIFTTLGWPWEDATIRGVTPSYNGKRRMGSRENCNIKGTLLISMNILLLTCTLQLKLPVCGYSNFRVHWTGEYVVPYSLEIAPPLMSYKYGEGAYNWTMVISLIHMPPSSLWSEWGKQQWQNCRSLRLAMKLVVAQLCKGSWNYQWKHRVCVARKRNAVFAPPPASNEPLAVYQITWLVYCWPVRS